LQRFLACLTAALEPYDLPWRVAPHALAILAQAEQGMGRVVGELVNALAAAEVPRGLIVVDDAHRLTDPSVFELLHKLLERWPEQWGLVIASRVEPPLPLARLRAAGELAEFGQRQLRFSPAEVTALLAETGLTATADDIAALLRRTHGWAAGLRLSLAVRPAEGASRAAKTTQRHLFDYLAAEVFDDMPAQLREFLLRCSVLPELTPARCAHVSGNEQAARLLDEVERRGLFVSVLDAHELTLRLHDLFRDFLEDRLLREQPEALPGLLRRAAEHEPDLARAVGYLARAGAWDEAVRVLAQRGPALLGEGGGPGLEQMLALFPAAEMERQPDLQQLRGLLAFGRYDWDTLFDAAQRAAEGYARAGRSRDEAVARAYAWSGKHHVGAKAQATVGLAKLRALELDDAARALILYVSAWDAFAGERSDEVVAMVTAMLDCLERIPDVRLWHQFANLSLFVGLPGMAPQLQRFDSGVMRIAGHTPSQLRTAVLHVRAGQAMGAGRLDEAWDWMQRADEECRWLGRPRLLMTDNALTHVLLHALRGEAEASREHGQQAVQDMLQNSAPSHRRVHLSDVLAAQSRAAWVLQDEAALRRLDLALRQATHTSEWAAAPRCRDWAAAFVALLDGRLDVARQLLAPMARDIERYRYFAGAQARFMLADIEARQGSLDAAAATLRPWLEQVQQGAEVGGALFAGLPVLQRLAALPWSGRLSPTAIAVLGHLVTLLPGVAPVPDPNLGGLPATHAVAGAPVSQGAALAQLSEREREVLARIAAGDSNKLIARAFALSPHTVKRHVANILDKLAVDTRGQAAARFRPAP
jgi:LuxR family maltose regulon positive regulatory protein